MYFYCSFNPIIVGGYAFLLNCKMVGRVSDYMTISLKGFVIVCSSNDVMMSFLEFLQHFSTAVTNLGRKLLFLFNEKCKFQRFGLLDARQ